MRLNYVIGYGLLTTHYFYLDREPYIADKIFIDERLHVHFSEDFVRDDIKYEVVHAWVWRWQEKRMEKCLRRLYKESLLRRGDYMKECETVFDELEAMLASRMTNVTQSRDKV